METDTYTLLYIKQITNEDLRIALGTQYSVMAYMGKESKTEWMYVYAKLSHFAVRLKLTQHCKSIIFQ